MSSVQEFFVVDLRREFGGKYITFWRPRNSNYAYPLEWSGRYLLGELRPGYHQLKEGGRFIRFAVPCGVVEGMVCTSIIGEIDGGVYSVVENTDRNRRLLRKNRFDFTVVGKGA